MNDEQALIQGLLKYLTELSRINVWESRRRGQRCLLFLVRWSFAWCSDNPRRSTGTADSIFETEAEVIICKIFRTDGTNGHLLQRNHFYEPVYFVQNRSETLNK